MATTYKVDGMTCNGCVRSVTGAIQRLDTRLVVDVKLAEGTATVDGPVTEAQVRAAVEGAGFDFGGAVG
jgi:copper chaperone